MMSKNLGDHNFSNCAIATKYPRVVKGAIAKINKVRT
jgi:hypothetical protein